jgi:hypothetical protein
VPSSPSLVICTPLFGTPSTASVSLGYHEMATMLATDQVLHLPGYLFTNCDLVRARSRAVHMFLSTSSAAHLLFWDGDVVPRDIRVLNRMIEANKDVIGLPYPRKVVDYYALSDAVRDEQEQEQLGRQSPDELEAAATQWPMMYDGDPVIGPDALAKCLYVPMGFTLISRSCLERMTEAYGDSLSFKDSSSGKVETAVALFMLMLRGGILFSEDYSFCQRWRDLGGEVWALLDPADHVGPHRYRGHWQGLVRPHRPVPGPGTSGSY